ncbi:hypothetical protein D9603_02085 [Pseudoalteromonas sp. PS5]|nr:hypothetical protein D9603_02085 [Pseudoalteromonas sp. PS5]
MPLLSVLWIINTIKRRGDKISRLILANSDWHQLILIIAQFEGVNLTLTALKTSYLQQVNKKFFLPTWV